MHVRNQLPCKFVLQLDNQSTASVSVSSNVHVQHAAHLRCPSGGRASSCLVLVRHLVLVVIGHTSWLRMC